MLVANIRHRSRGRTIRPFMRAAILIANSTTAGSVVPMSFPLSFQQRDGPNPHYAGEVCQVGHDGHALAVPAASL
jgi:hypothetical protein